MKAYVQARVISVADTPRSWTTKKGETVTVQDCYVLVEDDPRPVQAAAEPSLGVKAGESGMYHCRLYPSRFENRPLSVTLTGRVRAGTVAAVA